MDKSNGLFVSTQLKTNFTVPTDLTHPDSTVLG